jgi:hypothetical protein
LIDNDISAADIKEAFKGDSDVKGALAHYLKDHVEEEDDDDELSDDEDDEYEDY